MTHNTVMILLNHHPTYKPPCLYLITCTILSTRSETRVAKCGVFLCIAVISNFIQLTNKYGITLMNAKNCQSRWRSIMKGTATRYLIDLWWALKNLRVLQHLLHLWFLHHWWRCINKKQLHASEAKSATLLNIWWGLLLTKYSNFILHYILHYMTVQNLAKITYVWYEHVELDPNKHFITQGWNYTNAWNFGTTVRSSLKIYQKFQSLVIMTERFPYTFPMRKP